MSGQVHVMPSLSLQSPAKKAGNAGSSGACATSSLTFAGILRPFGISGAKSVVPAWEEKCAAVLRAWRSFFLVHSELFEASEICFALAEDSAKSSFKTLLSTVC